MDQLHFAIYVGRKTEVAVVLTISNSIPLIYQNLPANAVMMTPCAKPHDLIMVKLFFTESTFTGSSQASQ